MASPLDQQLIADAEGKLTAWHEPAVRWERVYWGIGLAGIICSALTAGTSIAGNLSPFLAVVAAICASFIGFFNPQKKATQLISAYRMVDAALRNYRANLIDDAALIKSIDQAEAMFTS